MTRIGTRGSALALAQASWVASQVHDAELVTITTAGDRGESTSDKSRWTSELERALLDGEIDLAVHSAKDVPGELAVGTEVLFVPAREDPFDAICGAASLEELAAGARVGTSSLRRAAQLRALREDLQIVELRGNVDTRLRKLAEGEADAIIVAAAGLRRLGREGEAGGVLDQLIPAPGQGALIVQAREDDPSMRRYEALANPPAAMAVAAERAFAYGIGSSCRTPLGAFAETGVEVHVSGDADAGRAETDDGAAGGSRRPFRPGEVRLRGWVGLPDGSQWIADEVTAPADQAGQLMAERMIAAGAMDLLARAEEMAGA